MIKNNPEASRADTAMIRYWFVREFGDLLAGNRNSFVKPFSNLSHFRRLLEVLHRDQLQPRYCWKVRA